MVILVKILVILVKILAIYEMLLSCAGLEKPSNLRHTHHLFAHAIGQETCMKIFISSFNIGLRILAKEMAGKGEGSHNIIQGF